MGPVHPEVQQVLAIPEVQQVQPNLAHLPVQVVHLLQHQQDPQVQSLQQDPPGQQAQQAPERHQNHQIPKVPEVRSYQ